METITMLELLTADEEPLRDALRANDSLDKSSGACAETLENELTDLVLRYNAAFPADRGRQSAANCLTATLRDALAFLKTGRAETGKTARRIAGGAILLLLGALILCATAVLLAGKTPLASYGCAAAAVLLGYLSGRVWYEKGETAVRAALDTDAVWHVFRQSVETMDRKLEEFCAWNQAADMEKAAVGADEAVSSEELKLFGDLLEALYAGNGDFALRQLGRVPEYLEDRGLSLVEYGPETRESFERFPTRRETATLRPALMRDDRLLMMGKASEHIE